MKKAFNWKLSARTSCFQVCLDSCCGTVATGIHAEPRNSHDAYAIAVTLDDAVVGHLPREFSHVAFYFLQHGGHITCEIT